MFFQNVTHLVCTAVKLITQAKLSIGRPMSLPSVSLSHCASVLKFSAFSAHLRFNRFVFLLFLCVFVVKNAFALSCNLLLATCDCHFGGLLPHIRRVCISGGHTGDIRGVDVISAPSAVLPAMQKCQFSGFSRASRPPFQRENCSLCSLRIKKVSQK